MADADRCVYCTPDREALLEGALHFPRPPSIGSAYITLTPFPPTIQAAHARFEAEPRRFGLHTGCTGCRWTRGPRVSLQDAPWAFASRYGLWSHLPWLTCTQEAALVSTCRVFVPWRRRCQRDAPPGNEAGCASGSTAQATLGPHGVNLAAGDGTISAPGSQPAPTADSSAAKAVPCSDTVAAAPIVRTRPDVDSWPNSQEIPESADSGQ